VLIAVYHVNCENPAGPISVTITPRETVLNLLDDGDEPNSSYLYAGKGVCSAIWTEPADICAVGTFTLTFFNGEVRTVQVDGIQGSYSCTTPSPIWRTITGANLNLTDDYSAAVTPNFAVWFGTTSYTIVGSVEILC